MDRNEKIIFRVTTEEKERIQRNADEKGMSVAEYLRELTGQDERLKSLDERMQALSDSIDANSETLDEHRKTIDAIEDAIRRGDFQEVERLGRIK